MLGKTFAHHHILTLAYLFNCSAEASPIGAKYFMSRNWRPK
jgi:hypothetical protein